MSYPSVVKVLHEKGLRPESASEAECREAIWEALKRDLKDGLAYVQAIAEEVNATGERVMRIGDPNSPLGKQVIRLMGADIARSICEEKFGVAFGFYNCHATTGGKTREQLQLTAREQILLQNGVLASADC